MFALAIPIFIKNRKYGSFLLALAVISSFGRIYIGIHYPFDVLGGAGIGLLIAWPMRRLKDEAVRYFSKHNARETESRGSAAKKPG